jgi:hypothetical protein
MTAKERLKLLTERQDRLARQVKSAQDALYKLLLESLDKIETNPAYIEQVFTQFNKSEGVQLVTTLAQDMGSIATANYSYFLAFKDELDLSQKDFGKIKSTVDNFLQERIGLSGNKVVKDSFLDSVLQDATVKQKVKQQAYANLMNGEGATAFRKNLKATVLGEQGKLGALESHYNTYVYDTYNQVDASLQEQYSNELGLTAFVYEGGVISTTRPFCAKKNGKLFLVSEAKEKWPTDSDLPKGGGTYNPLISRGKFNCRHSINFVSNRRALRMRDDLELVNGKLQVKN